MKIEFELNYELTPFQIKVLEVYLNDCLLPATTKPGALLQLAPTEIMFLIYATEWFKQLDKEECNCHMKHIAEKFDKNIQIEINHWEKMRSVFENLQVKD